MNKGIGRDDRRAEGGERRDGLKYGIPGTLQQTTQGLVTGKAPVAQRQKPYLLDAQLLGIAGQAKRRHNRPCEYVQLRTHGHCDG